MEVVLCNKLVYVIVYTSNGAIELLEHRLGWGGFMLEDVAHQFRHEFNDLLASHPEVEDFEEFIDHYSAMPPQSAVRH